MALIGACVFALAALGTIGSLIPPEPVSPPATVDDVYAALSVAMGGATPDFDTQVKPVLDRNLTYAALQDLVKSGRILSIAAPNAPVGPVRTAPPQVTAPHPPRPTTAAPNQAHTVAMTAL